MSTDSTMADSTMADSTMDSRKALAEADHFICFLAADIIGEAAAEALREAWREHVRRTGVAGVFLEALADEEGAEDSEGNASPLFTVALQPRDAGGYALIFVVKATDGDQAVTTAKAAYSEVFNTDYKVLDCRAGNLVAPMLTAYQDRMSPPLDAWDEDDLAGFPDAVVAAYGCF